jgi:hypothetical protein
MTRVKHHSSAERLADNKIIVFFKGRVIFKSYIPMKQRSFEIKLTHYQFGLPLVRDPMQEG